MNEGTYEEGNIYIIEKLILSLTYIRLADLIITRPQLSYIYIWTYK